MTDAEDESTDPVVSKQGEMTINQSEVPPTIASQSEMQVQPSEVSDIIDLDADDCEQETEPPKIGKSSNKSKIHFKMLLNKTICLFFRQRSLRQPKKKY